MRSGIFRPVYFLHIPKTAGLSVKRLMSAKFNDRLCPFQLWDDFFLHPEMRYQLFDAYAGHFSADLSTFLHRHLYSFTFLRDPVTRTISHYRHVSRDPHHPYHDIVAQQSLREFITNPVTLPLIYNFQARYLASSYKAIEAFSRLWQHSTPLRGTLSVLWEMGSVGLDEACLRSKALDTLHSLVAVGVTERFDESVKYLSQIFKLPEADGVRINEAPDGPLQDPIDSEIECLIRERTEIDQLLYKEANRRLTESIRGNVPAGVAKG